MKKVAGLISILALAACSTGGGSGLSATESNARVTGMNTFVVVGGNNPTVNPNGRGAVTQSDGGIRYDLENAKLKTIPTSGVISDLVFHTDGSGKIVSIEFADAENLGGDVIVGPIKRKGDTNIFVEKPGQLNMPQTGDIPIEYKTYARELGLKYADFGVLHADISALGNPTATVWEMPFAGGREEKKVDDEQMQILAQNGDIVFTGLAKGSVYYQDQENGYDEPLEGGLIDDQAQLTVDQTGKQTLAANFDNWARVEAVKETDGTNKFMVVENYLEPGSNYYLVTPEDGVVSGGDSIVFETGYYGDNNAPNEGVGLVQYQHMWELDVDEETGDEDYRYHLNVDLGFGGIKD